MRKRWIAPHVALIGSLALLLGIPEAGAQCLTGVRPFASIFGPSSITRLRVDPAGSHAVLGAEYGRFWQCVDSNLGNNFIPGDPARRMAPAGTNGCASRDPEEVGGGWWQVSATTLRGVAGFISGPGCFASSCPVGDMCTVVEDWGAGGPPGIGGTAYFIGWRTSETAGDLRWWDLARYCGAEDCAVPIVEFPLPGITAGPGGEFSVRSDRDPGAGAYVQIPDQGPASQLIESWDVLFHAGASDPGRDRNALCDGSPCWELVARVPYGDAPLGPTPVAFACGGAAPETGFVALGLAFEGGAPGGPVPSQLAGRAVPFDCSCADLDGDGWGCGDCDDADPTAWPGGAEACDGRDNDCDGLIDEESAWYRDSDGDSFGDPQEPIYSCEPPAGHVTNGLDCDDADANVNPDAEETCNGKDDDCDGVADDGFPTEEWYLDADSDGFGDPSQVVEACAGPDGYVANDLDCDDTDASVNPDAEEICNGKDDDCDGLADPNEDGDAFPVCMGDCDDANGTVYPGAPEICDGLNNDCDDPSWPVPPPGEHNEDGDPFPECAGDCDDTNGTVYPGAPEICDGLNNDCGDSSWPLPPPAERDDDGDGLSECAGDCDDARDTVYPGAPPICDGLNNDCDDPGWPVPPPADRDDDGDTFSECAGDCDDADGTVYPGAPEICDRLNNDCDDPGWPVPPPADRDDDGDTFSECAGDCDDANGAVHPGATETCNAADDDCDGLTDEDASGEDSDGDGLHNLCDSCPQDHDPSGQNSDGDPFGDACDDCPLIDDPDQQDGNQDGVGDACSAWVRIAKDDGVETYVPGGTLVYTITVEEPLRASESFDSGVLNQQWAPWSSRPDGRIQVTGQWGTAGGPYALWMDKAFEELYYFNLNEAIWTVDLSTAEQAELSFWTAEIEDEETYIPDTFYGHAYGDGIAISDDGLWWTTIFRPTDHANAVWRFYTIDLAAAAQAAGLEFGRDFRIKFQQYDDLYSPGDGRGYDSIEIDSHSTALTDPSFAEPPLHVVVEDDFPPELSCSWTCVAEAGSSCTPGPVAGDIVDSAEIVGPVTYTAICQVDGDATGPIANTATVTLPPELIDPEPEDNSATDVDEPMIDHDLDGRADDADNCPGAANADQADLDGDGAGDACDLCPSIANPSQDDEIACLATFGLGVDCLGALIDLVDPASDGLVEIRDSGGAVFSATPFASGDLPDLLDLEGMADGPGAICVTLASGLECAAFDKQGQRQLGIDGGCLSLPVAVATAALRRGCTSPTAATVLLDGSGSSDTDGDIVRYDWYEDYATSGATFLGSGAQLEVTLPVALHLITLRVTDSQGGSATVETAVSYPAGCWKSVDPVSIQLGSGHDGTRVFWLGIPGAASYDVIRGHLGQLVGEASYIDLGPVVCLHDDSHESGEAPGDPELPAAGEAFFYLVRREGETPGIYGTGWPAIPRSPGAGDCPIPPE